MSLLLFSEPTLNLCPYTARHRQRFPLVRLRDSVTDRMERSLALFDHLFNNVNNNTQQQQKQQLRDSDMDKWHINENSDELAYRFDVSGFRPEQLTVELHGDEIVVKGEHKEQKEGLSVHNRFSRSVRLPEAIVRESIRCVLEGDDDHNNALSARLCVCGKRQPTKQLEEEKKHKEATTYTIPVKVVDDESKQQQQQQEKQ
uniref:SHSP domain-containing protein n=1 Tax=Globodera pallida TaxID=36090 RepID=A0A183C835_GLOPA